MKAFTVQLAAASLVLGGGSWAAQADSLIAAGLSAPDYGADFSTSGTGPTGVNRWEAVFGKTIDGEPGTVYTAVWDGGASGPAGVQVQGPVSAGGGCSRFLLREGVWVAAREAEGGHVIGTVGAGAPGVVQTPCTPADSCGDSACEEINLNWSLEQTTDLAGTTRTVLLYGDWYHREGEEATVLARLDPAPGCETPNHSIVLDQPLAQHRDVCGAEGDDSFWVLSVDTTPEGNPELRYARLAKGLAGNALSSGTLSASLGEAIDDGAGAAAARHAVDAEGAAVRALWVDTQGVALADLATGEVTRISSAPIARRPDVAVSTAATTVTVTAAWETDAGVEVWRGATVETITGASAPRLEKEGADRVVLFYTKADADSGTGWSLYARPLD